MAVEVAFADNNPNPVFRDFLKKHTGGVPGQKDGWRGAIQWASQESASGDFVGIDIGNPELIRIYIRSGKYRTSEARTARMQRYSWTIRNRMSDQQLGDNLERNSARGKSMTVERPWARDEKENWPDAALWIKDQCERLHAASRSRLGAWQNALP